ncbi:MAG TPA: hypothetical protein VHA09_08815 [Nitrososphaera sp.]|nr:hypothetical protein [Nitrososphaera sp.]
MKKKTIKAKARSNKKRVGGEAKVLATKKKSGPRHAGKKIVIRRRHHLHRAHESRPKKAKAGRAVEVQQHVASKKIVRIMGHGQFAVDARTLKRLNDIDTVLVGMVASEKADDSEFKKKLTELNQITIKHGKAVEPGEIVRSDIILPSADLPIDEAKKLFIGEGVIPEN